MLALHFYEKDGKIHLTILLQCFIYCAQKSNISVAMRLLMYNNTNLLHKIKKWKAKMKIKMKGET